METSSINTHSHESLCSQGSCQVSLTELIHRVKDLCARPSEAALGQEGVLCSWQSFRESGSSHLAAPPNLGSESFPEGRWGKGARAARRVFIWVLPESGGHPFSSHSTDQNSATGPHSSLREGGIHSTAAQKEV